MKVLLTSTQGEGHVRPLVPYAQALARLVALDLPSLGFGVTVFLGVTLATKGRVRLEDFERAVSAIPEVQTV